MNLIPASEISVVKDGWFEILAHRKRALLAASAGDRAPLFVATFGSSTLGRRTAACRDARALGRELALQGAVVINGAYAGIMEAAAEGAAQAGGWTVGVTCDNLPEKAPNRFIKDEWKVERWDQRLLALIWLADAYAVFPGSSGTLTELAFTIETQLKGFIPARPIVCLGNYWKQVVRRLKEASALVKFTDSPTECANLLLK